MYSQYLGMVVGDIDKRADIDSKYMGLLGEDYNSDEEKVNYKQKEKK